jgi:hypothetical protein
VVTSWSALVSSDTSRFRSVLPFSGLSCSTQLYRYQLVSTDL